MREEWVREEKAWKEKTDEFSKNVREKQERAQKQGTKWRLEADEDEWLGLSDKYRAKGAPTPKVLVEKARIMSIYETTLKEEDFIGTIFKSVARLINSIEGDEQDKAIKDAASAARSAKPEEKEHYVRMLAYIKGDRATESLRAFSEGTDVPIAIAALESLGRQNSEKGMKALIDRLDDPRWQVRSAVLKGLSFFHDPVVMEALLAAAKKEEGVLRRKYFVAMARIVDEKVPGTIEAWDSFWMANKEDLIESWKIYEKGEPVLGNPPDVPIDTDLGSTSFYGIRTNSKHIIFVVDISGSMHAQEGQKEGQSRIAIARRELKKAIQSLSASDADERGAASFNIVIYSDDPSVYEDGKMIIATVKNKEKAVEWIDEHAVAAGQTNIFDAIEKAFNIISDKKGDKNLKKGADTIFLMTDGVPTRGKFFDASNLGGTQEVILREVRRLNKVRKITIHTIAIGGGNQIFLNMLAAQNDGQFLAR